MPSTTDAVALPVAAMASKASTYMARTAGSALVAGMVS
jgi:hypothetical protein